MLVPAGFFRGLGSREEKALAILSFSRYRVSLQKPHGNQYHTTRPQAGYKRAAGGIPDFSYIHALKVGTDVGLGISAGLV